MAAGRDIMGTELDGKLVLAAADQVPFISGPNTFCVLTPLLIADGNIHLDDEDRERLFPNRGRVWWMLRPDMAKEDIRAGMICTVRLEAAELRAGDSPDKDYYQANRRDAQVGSRSYMEVITLEKDPDLREVLNRSEVARAWRPTPRIMLAGPRSVLGPLAADWDSETGRTRFRAGNPGAPWVWLLSRSLLPKGAIQKFRYTANQWKKADGVNPIELAVLPESVLDVFQQKGERLDASSDEQIANWGFKILGLSKKDASAVKEFLKSVPSMDELEGNEEKMERFRAICGSAERVIALGEEVARNVASQEAFEKLVREHLDAVVEEEVELEVEERISEIERKTADARARLERLQAQVENVDEDYKRKARELETELEREHEQFLLSLEQREATLKEEEERFERRRDLLEQSLENVAQRFNDNAEGVLEDILAQLPVLSRLGLLGRDSGIVEGDRGGRPAQITHPAFLNRGRERGGLREQEFIDQFMAVTRRRGFVFDRDDLMNFHVSVKTGQWTVLAGPSGTGKSSLPRLYAEALGSADEMLYVPVRPDWMDDRDVLGGFNALSGRFEPSNTGLVDRLIAAAEDRRRGRGGIYVICLDEMNLARVEHYFAHFLSVMELPQDTRSIELFARGLSGADDPYAPWRKLPISPSVRFVGTVNVDETTHFFSPKVIDRASLLVLEPPDTAASAAATAEPGPAGGLAPVRADELEGWVRPHTSASDAARALIDEVNEVLWKHRVGLGHRPVQRFLGYVASADGLLPPDRAMDFALSQIVLPRLKTTTYGYEDMLAGLAQLLPDSRFGRSFELLERLTEAKGEYDFFQLL